MDYSIKEAEQQNLIFRRSIYFVRDLAEGTIVTEKDVRVIRPGFGLAPNDINRIIGRRLKVDVKRGKATTWEHFY